MLHSFPVSGVGQRQEFTFSTDSRRLLQVCVSHEPCWHEVCVWDTQDGKLVYHRRQNDVQGGASTLSPDGSIVIFNGVDRRPGHDGEVVLEAIDLDSKRIMRVPVEGMQPGNQPIWVYDSVVSGSSRNLYVQTHFREGSRILSTPWSPIVEGLRNSVHIQPVNTNWTAVTDFHPGVGLQFSCSPDESTLAIGNRDPHMVRIVDRATGLCRLTLEGLPDWGYCLSFEGNEHLAVRHDASRAQTPGQSDSISSGSMSVLTIWNLVSDQRTTIEADVSSLAWHEPTRTRIVGQAGGQLTAIRDRLAEPYKLLSGHQPSEAWGVAFSSNGQRLYSVGDDATLKVWDMKSGTLLSSQKDHESLVSCLAVSPDGRWIATGSYDDTVILWDAESASMKHRLTGHSHDLRTLAFSPDSLCLASAGRCSEIRLWSVEHGTLISAIPRHDSVVRGLEFLSPTSFVETNDEGLIVFHDVSGEQAGKFSKRVLAELPQEIHSLAMLNRNFEQGILTESDPQKSGLVLSPVKQRLIVGGKFGMVNVLPVGVTSSEHGLVPRIATMQPLQRLHGVDIRSIAVAPDGRSVAISGDDQVVHLVSLQTGQELLSFFDLPAPVNQLAFSPHGDHMAAALHNGEIRIWSTKTSWNESELTN
jgi:WD40 repeat protein